MRGRVAAMRAMLFGAGLGTRLRPLTERLPKPVVPFFDRPLAAWALEHLARSGARSVVMNTHYGAARVEAAMSAFVEAAGLPVRFGFSREERLLGTGGGLRAAVEREDLRHGRMRDDDVFVVVNGDILFFPPLERIIAEHRARGAEATMVQRRVDDPFSLGAIEIAPDGRVVAMLEKERVSEGGAPAMFSGVHVFSRPALDRLPRLGCVVRDGYRRWLAEGRRLFGTLAEDPWVDLGTPRAYRDAHLDVLRGERALPGLEARGGWIDASARVASGATIEESVVGAGATISAVRVVRSIVWPGASVLADVEDAIVLGDGRIHPL